MSDKLVFDLAQEIEGSPNVFVRKDWINILDNQNQNYNNNQSVLDTSQLSNSNKYMSYREAYLSIPLLLTVAATSAPAITGVISAGVTFGSSVYFQPARTSTTIGNDLTGTGADRAVGLKNWFGQIIHSFTLDYNGTTIIQQTPYINMWNSFKLMTSLSLGDIRTQGATIGFYPDDALAFQYLNAGDGFSTVSPNGYGTLNNDSSYLMANYGLNPNVYNQYIGNDGLHKRQNLINFDLDATTLPSTATNIGNNQNYGNLYNGYGFTPTSTGSTVNAGLFVQSWRSYIFNKINGYNVLTIAPNNNGQGVLQYAIVATVYLKHIHSFFNMCPLLKGVFMKMTMNLNNSSTSITCGSTLAANSSAIIPQYIAVNSVSIPVGGVNPVFISNYSEYSTVAQAVVNNGGTFPLFATGNVGNGPNVAALTIRNAYTINLSVGATVLNSQVAQVPSIGKGTLSQSIYLYIPAYTFNPVFEQAYLSNPVKQIKYTDVYQYQVLNIGSGQQFNNLLTNGIANIKSVLLLPFYSATGGTSSTNTVMNIPINSNTGFNQGVPVWQSPFDPAGTGPTSPLCTISNFNIQISGQNAIYNIEKYSFEQFNNQLYGQNAVNGGLTDGITSGLIDRQDFDMEYCYYYVNVERMLPVEETVPKSVQILGQNLSAKNIDLYCFIEYGTSINIDCLTGARV